MPKGKNELLRNRIRTLYLENYTNIEIAQKVGVSREWVRVTLKEFGWKSNPATIPHQWNRPDFRPRLTLRERFPDKIQEREADECWPWIAKSRLATGHGLMYTAFRRKKILAHRLAFWLGTGRWPKMLVLHKCGNAGCCNPKHLYEGTSYENAQDRWRHHREGKMSYPITIEYA